MLLGTWEQYSAVLALVSWSQVLYAWSSARLVSLLASGEICDMSLSVRTVVPWFVKVVVVLARALAHGL